MTSPKLYLDEHISFVVARILSGRGQNVLRTQDAKNEGCSDSIQLGFAAKENRCLVSHTVKDFIQLHAQYVRERREHGGILLLRHDPRPSVVASRILKRLASETGDSVRCQILFG
jgi:predicted nuclease of predicted toxin-antitoxin system